MDHLVYNHNNISKDIENHKDFVHLKMAYIDSGNSSLQLMQSDFDQLYAAMKEQVESIEKDCPDLPNGIRCTLKSEEKCDDIE